ncbi:MAG TPA: DUF1800 domain-containing protein [Fimbriimonas sp.]|nr:DUF1800 domain-containing protein [Fimbriimonas sp.]
MKVTRRGVLTSAGLLALGGCAQVARRLPKNEPPEDVSLPKNPDRTVRLLNRAGFGPTPGQVAQVEALGHERWIEDQLARRSPEDYRLNAQLARLDVLRIDGYELRDMVEDHLVRQLNQAALLRATYSGDQIYERMVDFWTNHFNIYARKGLAAYRKAKDEREVVRKNALGSFPDMLKASARSPAMLAYLDNQFSRQEAPNENYARELMELHTLGVHGGYTQKDVREVARCFTGWTIQRGIWGKGQFTFDPDRHDKGAKSVLGLKIPAGGGIEDGERVLEHLAMQPQTANFVAGKLCRHFLGDAASPVRERLANEYLSTNGDIKAMLRVLFSAPALLDGPPVAKRPFDFVVSALRATNAESDCGEPLLKHLANMGQSLYEWPMPDGYPDGAQPWTGSLLARWNFAMALTSQKIQGTDLQLADLADRTKQSDAGEAAATLVLSRPLTREERQTYLKHAGQNIQTATALMIASPEFQWR